LAGQDDVSDAGFALAPLSIQMPSILKCEDQLVRRV